MSEHELDSILTSIKKLIGPVEEYEHFDTDLIFHINAALSILTQLGIGPKKGFLIRDKSAVWTDFLKDEIKLEMVKSYVYMKVKLVFDPPTSSAAVASMERMITEFEWRSNVAVETK